jgi:hypothetical protein
MAERLQISINLNGFMCGGAPIGAPLLQSVKRTSENNFSRVFAQIQGQSFKIYIVRQDETVFCLMHAGYKTNAMPSQIKLTGHGV